ncbi:hypothetical protein HGM15179_003048 [Zosterops borbonicus]|uniref:Uncharacterized protein n=1 Tax=Zosterops borbonicus TaxID=364589 RepID=A0A8K1GUH8_9PASS|nr:hypothetical protein HGM15179_003048 [Zosterops borbonicus]
MIEGINIQDYSKGCEFLGSHINMVLEYIQRPLEKETDLGGSPALGDLEGLRNFTCKRDLGKGQDKRQDPILQRLHLNRIRQMLREICQHLLQQRKLFSTNKITVKEVDYGNGAYLDLANNLDRKNSINHMCKNYLKNAFSQIFVMMSLLLGGICLTCDMVDNSGSIYDFRKLKVSIQDFNFLMLMTYMQPIMKKYFQFINLIAVFQQTEALDI